MQVLMLSPEAPYPLHGGGAFRTASLLHFFARFADVDLILLTSSDEVPELPPGLVRRQHVIRLPHHGKGLAERYVRNASRSIRGVPPLVDRFSGFDQEIEQAVGGHRYDLGIVEHFWCAPYIDLMERFCTETVLDLHNIESVLHKRCARTGAGGDEGTLLRLGHRRFAESAQRLESTLLPRYSSVMTTSEEDARQVAAIAPTAKIQVYPNALPRTNLPQAPEYPRVVFSGNFEYHPNIDAVRWLIRDIWPEVKKRDPKLRLRLVGRNEAAVGHLLTDDVEVTGEVDDALAEIAQARVVIAPLRAGSGTRLKILEAWAAGRCVVATTLAAEGLAACDGINIAIEDDPRQFAARVVRLASDPAERARLGAAGRRTFEDKYCWETVWESLYIGLQLTRTHEVNGYTGKF